MNLCGGGLVAKLFPTFATPWTIARQAYLSMGFSRQEYWNGLPLPSLGDLPDSGIKLRSLVPSALQPDSLSPAIHKRLETLKYFCERVGKVNFY